MSEILFLDPVFKKMPWGGERLRTSFGYDTPGGTGEAWIAASHPEGDCAVSEGSHKGETLSSLWKDHRELFGNAAGDRFPLLVKIIDAKSDLSIQVHPDSTYAMEHENGESGKTECWYILDCEKDASIVVGHNASTKEELRQMIRGGEWEKLIRLKPVSAGDFFQITPGTVHAIRGGTLLIEIQENSAVTYRLYDYDRLVDGRPRELHIDKSIDVIRCPHTDCEVRVRTEKRGGYTKKELISCACYTVDQYDVTDVCPLKQEHPFLIVTVIDGGGAADGHPVKKGDCFILPCGYGRCLMKGKMSFITSHI